MVQKIQIPSYLVLYIPKKLCKSTTLTERGRELENFQVKTGLPVMHSGATRNINTRVDKVQGLRISISLVRIMVVILDGYFEVGEHIISNLY